MVLSLLGALRKREFAKDKGKVKPSGPSSAAETNRTCSDLTRACVAPVEVIPIDGIIISPGAMIDEAVLTGEPIPVTRREGELARSGTVNAGETFEIRATATAGESTYAGIIRLVNAAQTAKAPFIRLADRYALLLFPITLIVAGGAWLLSGDPIRGLAVLVAATPCPLILAAPVAFIAGVAQAARLGILIKGGKPFEALARTHTVMFDKTGTLTVGGARLVAIEAAPGERPEDVLRMAGSLEQASHHVVAAAIVEAARGKGLDLQVPTQVCETMGSGLEGMIDGRVVRVGSHQLVYGSRKPEEWAVRALRRAAWRSALSVFVAVDGRTIGALLLGDELRRETPRAVQALRTAGISRIVMLTGDRADAAETIGAALDLDAVLADRVPSDKVDAVATEQRQSLGGEGNPPWRLRASASPWGQEARARHRRRQMSSYSSIGSIVSLMPFPSQNALTALPCKAWSPGWRCPGSQWRLLPSVGCPRLREH